MQETEKTESKVDKNNANWIASFNTQCMIMMVILAIAGLCKGDTTVLGVLIVNACLTRIALGPMKPLED